MQDATPNRMESPFTILTDLIIFYKLKNLHRVHITL